MLGGVAGMCAQRQAKQSEVVQALAKLAAEHGREPALAAKTADVQKRWQTLAAAVAGKSLKPAESNAQHAELVREEMELLRMVVDTARLSMDSEPASVSPVVAINSRSMPSSTGFPSIFASPFPTMCPTSRRHSPPSAPSPCKVSGRRR